ncbi:hypothetical protein ACJ67_08010 [Methylophilus sp. TWE2]|nr:hypothetical protein ACJ67_08010 [Methylophilus sp. TWE2]
MINFLKRYWHRPGFLFGTAALLGALTVLGFAPFYFYSLPLITLLVLCWLLCRSKTSFHAFGLGLCFGLGMYAVGLSWMVTTLHDFGEMPLWLAYLSTAILCLYLASFTALATWLTVYVRALWCLPFAWGAGDWLRGYIGGGFPWLTMGYTQVPGGLLTSYLPVTGIYGLSVILLGVVVTFCYVLMGAGKTRWLGALSTIVIVALAMGLQHVSWTTKGDPVRVALLQGNIAQQTKWSVEQSKQIILGYLDLMQQADAEVLVLPETAFPIFLSQAMGKTKDKLMAVAFEKHADILVGMLDWQEVGVTRQKFNAVVNYGVSGLQVQHKTHLVPFGEFVPLPFLFSPIYQHWFHMPHNDFSVGQTKQLFLLGANNAAVSICYDDLFGADLAEYAREASYIVSVSNGAWFGHSAGLEQYLQFTQARAIESQKMIARASNNGITAFIDKNGEVLVRAAKNKALTLNYTVDSYQGSTLYSRCKDAIFYILQLIGLICIASRLISVKKNSQMGGTYV